jgi:hypothetical protein
MSGIPMGLSHSEQLQDRLAFVVAQIKWDKGGTESAEDYIFSMEREMKIIKEDRDFCISENQRAVTRVIFLVICHMDVKC